ncbi:MAG: NAD(+) diphosphatase [Oscillospiraceae bacterium]|nr:NAD(+) diphosphatase [Oscillospiraceae bacterium]
MIQDIFPHRLSNSYINTASQDSDTVMIFDDRGRIAVCEGSELKFPLYGDMADTECVFLFCIDDRRYFMPCTDTASADGTVYRTVKELRSEYTGTEVFAAFTAYHLWRWYRDNIYCGRCAGKLGFHGSERALVCPACNNTVYPRINPAVIVGVIKGDSILITRYQRGYAHNALVAGFTEIGETLEQTVEREVMEETGIRVKNIRYYASQPWGTAQDMLVGFFCEAEGDDPIRRDDSELRYAEWVRREDIVLQPDDVSLTNDMMKRFRDCPGGGITELLAGIRQASDRQLTKFQKNS